MTLREIKARRMEMLRGRLDLEHETQARKREADQRRREQAMDRAYRSRMAAWRRVAVGAIAILNADGIMVESILRYRADIANLLRKMRLEHLRDPRSPIVPKQQRSRQLSRFGRALLSRGLTTDGLRNY